MLRRIFSNGWVQIAVVVSLIIAVYYFIKVRGLNIRIQNDNLNSFDIKADKGFETIYNKTFAWGDSFSEKMGDSDVTMTSDKNTKIVMVIVKWPTGQSSWIRWDYLNQKGSSGRG